MHVHMMYTCSYLHIIVCIFVEETGDVRHDIGHILDFFTRLKSLLVEGSSTEIGNSNININMLPFVMHFFKNITCLKVSAVCCVIMPYALELSHMAHFHITHVLHARLRWILF